MNTQRIIITGINGFVGHHLARELVSHGATVVGLGHDAEVAPDLQDIVAEYHSADLIEQWPEVENIDAVIHLAGLAAVGPSFDNPQRYINANSAMVTNMCEYFMGQEKKPRILIVSSGAVYSSDQEMPITENSLVGFSSPYAVSKILTENQGAYYRKRGLDCIIARPFNHIGPGQGLGFILPDLYEQLHASQESGKMLVGNLETKRDYTDVRDIVRAYSKIVLAESLKYDTYNICSGASRSGREILELLKELAHITDVDVEIDQSKIRPNDIMNIVGDSSRLKEELGWNPTYLIDQTIADFIAAKK
jgi:GDP-4-dehydro-6-deoxy-D-mannose reductase